MKQKSKYIDDDLERMWEIERIFNQELKRLEKEPKDIAMWLGNEKELYEYAAVMAHHLENNYGKNYINIGFSDFYWHVVRELEKASKELKDKAHKGIKR